SATFFQAEDGIRDRSVSRGLGDVYKRQGQYILEVICGSYEDLNVSFYGGPNAERKRAIISPNYYGPKESDFELTLMEIDYPEKFVTLKPVSYTHL
ncbi:YlmH/Sll1252 family protein, partial [Staphylococcus aureus]